MLSQRIRVSTTNLDMSKQVVFALAATLTAVAKLGQTASIKAIEGAFTVRTNWDKPSNVFGVRVKPATKTNLTAVVGTAAEWLEKFVREPQGSVVLKLPRGEFLAIPTTNVRRTKRDLIRATQRPQAIRGKRDFLVPLRSGRGYLLLQRQGRGRQKKNVVLYVLVKRARIKEKDVFYGPVRRAFEQNFDKVYRGQLERALATARK
jgi:hypothetical protein